MITTERTWSGAEPVGGPSPNPPRKVNAQLALLQKDFTTAQQVVPVRVVFGRSKVAGVQITPVFGMRSEEAKIEGGGK